MEIIALGNILQIKEMFIDKTRRFRLKRFINNFPGHRGQYIADVEQQNAEYPVRIGLDCSIKHWQADCRTRWVRWGYKELAITRRSWIIIGIITITIHSSCAVQRDETNVTNTSKIQPVIIYSKRYSLSKYFILNFLPLSIAGDFLI